MAPGAEDVESLGEDAGGVGLEDERVRALVARAAGGEREATDELYRLYQADLVATAHVRLGHTLQDLTESADLVQSVWTDLLEDLPDFEYRGPGSFAAWLRACLVNKIRAKRKYFGAQKREVKRLRRMGEGEEPPARPSDPTPSQAVAGAEELARLATILERFPESQRRALLLRLRDGLSFAEIGRVLERSEEAAKKLYQRALKSLIPLLPPEWVQG